MAHGDPGGTSFALGRADQGAQQKHDSGGGRLERARSQTPATLRRSLTWGRRLEEMARHKTFTVATDVKVSFCDPQRPWQRGINENTCCYGNIFLEERTCPFTRKRNSIEFRCA
jgi:IS30 family transposase